MTSSAISPEQYINEVPEDRREALQKLREVILSNLPKGFKEGMQYGMIGYSVPHEIYPAGYHCDPKIPLPFMSFASQKNSINFYHMGIYAKKELYDWFVSEFPKHSKKKLDMGKSCMRFKKVEDIPYELLGELSQKLTPEEWIEIYEAAFKK
ncbi:DUF1801 domain-containing protein [Flavobacterium okayamense]|uniref:YdhG-like domain-containing protein n=1 Tax=Flavobacterium okayamense TaxID=2830782 RepID=A0ABM7S834_9FLAO|nr:DUF1801 domain-containing protein [Flavobacterium okayamense]BCY29085.1 hypothetical protein KK2020170_19530 [Flavobacterium okayamense]